MKMTKPSDEIKDLQVYVVVFVENRGSTKP